MYKPDTSTADRRIRADELLKLNPRLLVDNFVGQHKISHDLTFDKKTTEVTHPTQNAETHQIYSLEDHGLELLPEDQIPIDKNFKSLLVIPNKGEKTIFPLTFTDKLVRGANGALTVFWTDPTGDQVRSEYFRCARYWFTSPIK